MICRQGSRRRFCVDAAVGLQGKTSVDFSMCMFLYVFEYVCVYNCMCLNVCCVLD